MRNGYFSQRNNGKEPMDPIFIYLFFLILHFIGGPSKRNSLPKRYTPKNAFQYTHIESFEEGFLQSEEQSYQASGSLKLHISFVHYFVSLLRILLPGI